MIKVLSLAILIIFLAACSQQTNVNNETNKSSAAYTGENMKKTIPLGEKFTLQKSETRMVQGLIMITFLGSFHKHSSDTGVCIVQVSKLLKRERLEIHYEGPVNKAQQEWNGYLISLEGTVYDENATFIITKLEK